MIKQSYFHISAMFLSLVIIVQSILIVDKIEHPNSGQVADILVGEYAETETEVQPTASLWLEESKIPNFKTPEFKDMVLWLDNSKESQSVYAVLNYDPEDIEIIDQNPYFDGIQLFTGEADQYLINQVDSDKGRIEILGRFYDPSMGKKMVASISALKKTERMTDIDFDYTEFSREGSYVSDGEHLNLLNKTNKFSF